MSLHPHIIVPVPEETARVARAAFPKAIPISPFGMPSGLSFRTRTFAPYSPGGANRACPRGSWHW